MWLCVLTTEGSCASIRFGLRLSSCNPDWLNLTGTLDNFLPHLQGFYGAPAALGLEIALALL